MKASDIGIETIEFDKYRELSEIDGVINNP